MHYNSYQFIYLFAEKQHRFLSFFWKLVWRTKGGWSPVLSRVELQLPVLLLVWQTKWMSNWENT